jgi:calcineurin-like phosphoesterase family protein
MVNIPRKIIGNIEINKGSILLVFDEHDAEIVRNWRIIVKSDDVIDPGVSLSP